MSLPKDLRWQLSVAFCCGSIGFIIDVARFIIDPFFYPKICGDYLCRVCGGHYWVHYCLFLLPEDLRWRPFVVNVIGFITDSLFFIATNFYDAISMKLRWDPSDSMDPGLRAV